MREASVSASVGPATIRNIAARMNTAIPTVSPIAVSRLFHQGRDSVTSYAALSVVMMDTIAPELLQMVTKKREGQDAAAVLLGEPDDRVRQDLDDVGRAIRPTITTTLSIKPCSGKKLATAMTKSRAREQGEEKVVGLLGGQVEDVVRQRLFDAPFEQFFPSDRHSQVCQHARLP